MTSRALSHTAAFPYAATAFAVIAGIAALRLGVLYFSPLNLYPDEAQYWLWSREFDFGYFSKPPMLAWVIGLTTSLCGEGEFCTRLGSPVLHGATSAVMFFTGRYLYDARAGFWAAIVHATLPGIWYSGNFISTDVPLLFFWALALLAFARMVEEVSWSWAVVLGITLGLGFLSKYAMIYFVVGMALFLFFDKSARSSALTVKFLAALGIAFALFAPNIAWNLAHDFATVSHTAANANWRAGSMFHLDKALAFFANQFLVFGPILFAALLIWFATVRTRLKRTPERRSDLYLICFIVPALAIVLTQAFLSRANANWAAVSYGAASLLVTAWLLRANWRPLIAVSITLNTLVGSLFLMLMLYPNQGQAFLRLDAAPLREMQGWDDLARAVTARVTEGHEGKPFAATVIAKRRYYAALSYYTPQLSVPLLTIDRNGVPEDHFELTAPLTPAAQGTLLLIDHDLSGATPQEDFAQAELLDTLVIKVGPQRTRTFRFYAVREAKFFKEPETP